MQVSMYQVINNHDAATLAILHATIKAELMHDENVPWLFACFPGHLYRGLDTKTNPSS